MDYYCLLKDIFFKIGITDNIEQRTESYSKTQEVSPYGDPLVFIKLNHICTLDRIETEWAEAATILYYRTKFPERNLNHKTGGDGSYNSKKTALYVATYKSLSSDFQMKTSVSYQVSAPIQTTKSSEELSQQNPVVSTSQILHQVVSTLDQSPQPSKQRSREPTSPLAKTVHGNPKVICPHCKKENFWSASKSARCLNQYDASWQCPECQKESRWNLDTKNNNLTNKK